MPVRFVAVRFAASDPEVLGGFWADVLDRQIIAEANGVMLPGSDTQLGLRFVAATSQTSGRNRLHLHLTSATAEDQQRTVETVLRLGGRRFGTRPLRFGRDYIFLAEFTCHGTREVGMFWRDALGWPLVWDQGEQTAVQSPRGGTKISWDSWPLAIEGGTDRQQFDLAAPEPAAEAARLVALGATDLGGGDDRVELADPDGNRFSISLPIDQMG